MKAYFVSALILVVVSCSVLKIRADDIVIMQDYQYKDMHPDKVYLYNMHAIVNYYTMAHRAQRTNKPWIIFSESDMIDISGTCLVYAYLEEDITIYKKAYVQCVHDMMYGVVDNLYAIPKKLIKKEIIWNPT